MMQVIGETGVPLSELQRLGRACATLPDFVQPHRVINKLYEQRRAMTRGDPDDCSVDWALAEQLAWASLLAEGVHVRISGQDVERGTFSHRHAVVQDQKTFEKYTPLKHLAPAPGGNFPAPFEICNSSLSEYGVLGFELGYSLESARALVVWEAQFGDFANCAQPIIDQCISSAEVKWQQQTGLVLLLPHGLEGGAPEHSSARFERCTV